MRDSTSRSVGGGRATWPAVVVVRERRHRVVMMVDGDGDGGKDRDPKPAIGVPWPFPDWSSSSSSSTVVALLQDASYAAFCCDGDDVIPTAREDRVTTRGHMVDRKAVVTPHHAVVCARTADATEAKTAGRDGCRRRRILVVLPPPRERLASSSSSFARGGVPRDHVAAATVMMTDDSPVVAS